MVTTNEISLSVILAHLFRTKAHRKFILCVHDMSALQYTSKCRQVAQLSQTDRAAGWVSFGQTSKTIFCRQYISIFNHCDIRGLQSYLIRRNKAK